MTATITRSAKVADLTAHRTEIDELLSQLAAARAAIKAQEGIVKLADTRLRALLGDADQAVVEGRVRYTLSHRTNTGLKRDVVKRLAPAVYQAAFQSTPYTVLVPK